VALDGTVGRAREGPALLQRLVINIQKPGVTITIRMATIWSSGSRRAIRERLSEATVKYQISELRPETALDLTRQGNDNGS
jgi:hypothetical protein